MKVIFIALLLSGLTGCASLPKDYSKITLDQLIKGIASNNKSKIRSSNYDFKDLGGIVMHSVNYNVVGSYTSGAVLDAIEESEKYCKEQRSEISPRVVELERSFLFCNSGNSKFLAFHYVSTQRAGGDTGQTYAYFDHIAFFSLNKVLKNADIETVAKSIVEFEQKSVEEEYVLKYKPLPIQKVVSILEKYLG
ncbi:hypothetical protein AMS57_05260 [Pseudoalteromonas undina]|uniref:hypothetical protein n=1 Tax=Pseudoalteromonas undina TaxID=43660 RepID=UPI0006BAA483|nr:hypothetical protein [Pseudoalteromonas undina]KPH91496.1 hypothetical protein AMS57_05260 [Pseudoalteromonas undina]